jgi:hypothetical protein
MGLRNAGIAGSELEQHPFEQLGGLTPLAVANR